MRQRAGSWGPCVLPPEQAAGARNALSPGDRGGMGQGTANSAFPAACQWSPTGTTALRSTQEGLAVRRPCVHGMCPSEGFISEGPGRSPLCMEHSSVR